MKTTLALFALLCASPCLAQDPTKGKDQPFTLAAGDISLPDLIDRCAEYLGYNILRNPAELQMGARRAEGPGVHLQQPISTGKDGCENLLTSMLWSQGFALVEIDASNGTREVIAWNGTRARDITARAKVTNVEQILARPSLIVPVTTTMMLKYSNAPVVMNSLRPFLATTGGLASTITLGTGGNNSLLLTGMQDQVAQVIEMVQRFDVPPAGARAAAAPVAERLATKVEELEKRIAALEQQLAALKAK